VKKRGKREEGWGAHRGMVVNGGEGCRERKKKEVGKKYWEGKEEEGLGE